MKPIETNNQKGPPMTHRKAKPSHIQLFRRLDSQPDNESPLEKAFLILCTPRSGSTFFSESLNACGKLGYCEEWFNYDYFEAWSQVTGNAFDLKTYMEWVSKKSLRNTGVLTMKLHIGQLWAMNQDHNMGLEAMDFSHVVYMYRKDKIAQAVSLLKAASTGQYRSTEEASGECQLSRAGIADGLLALIKFEQFTHSYMSQYIDEQIAYEDFWVAPDEYCNEVLKALDKAPCEPGDFAAIPIKKQANKQNFDAARDFRQYILGEVK